MIAIAVVVAVAADRVASTSRTVRRALSASQRAPDHRTGGRAPEACPRPARRRGPDAGRARLHARRGRVHALGGSQRAVAARAVGPPSGAGACRDRARGHPRCRLPPSAGALCRDRPRGGNRAARQGDGGARSTTSRPRPCRPGLLDPQAEIDVYRVVQEALANAVRHSRAKLISVAVSSADQQL